MLDVPLADRNTLLLSAGYAPAYGERPLSAPELEPVRRALTFTLRQQEPFPALVVDGDWNVVMSNDASHRIFDLFDSASSPLTPRPNRPHDASLRPRLNRSRFRVCRSADRQVHRVREA